MVYGLPARQAGPVSGGRSENRTRRYGSKALSASPKDRPIVGPAVRVPPRKSKHAGGSIRAVRDKRKPRPVLESQSGQGIAYRLPRRLVLSLRKAKTNPTTASNTRGSKETEISMLLALSSRLVPQEKHPQDFIRGNLLGSAGAVPYCLEPPLLWTVLLYQKSKSCQVDNTGSAYLSQ